MPFHRYTAPSYHGGLPSGYDYLNSPALNGDPGSPAPADGKKASGPNQGTYLVAFQEDATSSNANRGLAALGENTDTLDDLLRRDLAVPVRTANATAASPVTALVITGQVYVGNYGATSTPELCATLVSVVDGNDNELVNASSTVSVSSITDSLGVNVVGTSTSGFYDSPVVHFSTPIPSGSTYRLYYGERGNLATLPKDALTSIKIRGAQEVSGPVEILLRDLHSTDPTSPWDAPWVTTIRDIAHGGINTRYRNGTSCSYGYALNVPGAGGFIYRDGPALRFDLPSTDHATLGVSSPSPDPQLACIKLVQSSTGPYSSTYSGSHGGDVGLYQESQYHFTTDATNERAYRYATGPLVMDAVPHNFGAATIQGYPAITLIRPEDTVIGNPTSGSSAADRCTFALQGANYIMDSSERTAVRETDLFEVSDVAGNKLGTFALDGISTDKIFKLRTLTGEANPTIVPAGGTTPVRIRWIQPTLSLGGRMRDSNGGSKQPYHMYVAQPSPAVWPISANNIKPAAGFFSVYSDRALYSTAGEDPLTALVWGGFDIGSSTSDWVCEEMVRGKLYGDGGIKTLGGRQTLNFPGRKSMHVGLGTSWVLNPMANGSHMEFTLSGSLTGTNFTLAAGPYEAGDVMDVFLRISETLTGPFYATWPSDFVFSGDDGSVPTSGIPGTTIVIHYRFTYVGMTSKWYAQRTDY